MDPRFLVLFAGALVAWYLVYRAAGWMVAKVFSRHKDLSTIHQEIYPKNGTYEAWLNVARESLRRSRERRNA